MDLLRAGTTADPYSKLAERMSRRRPQPRLDKLLGRDGKLLAPLPLRYLALGQGARSLSTRQRRGAAQQMWIAVPEQAVAREEACTAADPSESKTEQPHGRFIHRGRHLLGFLLVVRPAHCDGLVVALFSWTGHEPHQRRLDGFNKFMRQPWPWLHHHLPQVDGNDEQLLHGALAISHDPRLSGLEPVELWDGEATFPPPDDDDQPRRHFLPVRGLVARVAETEMGADELGLALGYFFKANHLLTEEDGKRLEAKLMVWLMRLASDRHGRVVDMFHRPAGVAMDDLASFSRQAVEKVAAALRRKLAGFQIPRPGSLLAYAGKALLRADGRADEPAGWSLDGLAAEEPQDRKEVEAITGRRYRPPTKDDEPSVPTRGSRRRRT